MKWKQLLIQKVKLIPLYQYFINPIYKHIIFGKNLKIILLEMSVQSDSRYFIEFQQIMNCNIESVTLGQP